MVGKARCRRCAWVEGLGLRSGIAEAFGLCMPRVARNFIKKVEMVIDTVRPLALHLHPESPEHDGAAEQELFLFFFCKY